MNTLTANPDAARFVAQQLIAERVRDAEAARQARIARQARRVARSAGRSSATWPTPGRAIRLFLGVTH